MVPPRFFEAGFSTRLPLPGFFVADESSCDLSSRIGAVCAVDDVGECGAVEVACVDRGVAMAHHLFDVVGKDARGGLCFACSSSRCCESGRVVRPGESRDGDDDRHGEEDGEDDQHGDIIQTVSVVRCSSWRGSVGSRPTGL